MKKATNVAIGYLDLTHPIDNKATKMTKTENENHELILGVNKAEIKGTNNTDTRAGTTTSVSNFSLYIITDDTRVVEIRSAI